MTGPGCQRRTLAPFNLPQIKAITDRDDMELCGLRWENVSTEHQVSQVCETRNRLPNYDSSIEAATTKTENSGRTVYLLDDLLHDLESYKAIKPYELRTYQDLFKRCVRQAGIPDANFHALRRPYVKYKAKIFSLFFKSSLLQMQKSGFQVLSIF